MRKQVLIYYGLCTVIAVFMLVFVLTNRSEVMFVDDASQYNQLAIGMLTRGEFSVEPGVPFFAREPGYSVFLMPVYALFGIENYIAVMLLQVALFFTALFYLQKELRHWLPPLAVTLFGWIAALHPAFWMAHFSVLRESIAASTMMFSLMATLILIRTKNWKWSLLAGVGWGYLILTYAAYMLFPLGFVFFLLPFRVRYQQIALMLAAVGLVLAPWAVRNILYQGEPCLGGCHRSDLQLAVRGEQAATLRGFEPFWCMYAEYISRDYSNRSPNCHFNAVMHRLFPDGFEGSEADAALGTVGKQQIADNFGWYLWHSLFEIVELHLPYVGGWGTGFNIVVALATIVLAVGFLAGLYPWHSVYLILLPVFGYTIVLFSLLDAIPRYLIPMLSCYCLIAGVGYNMLYQKIRSRL